MLLRHCENEFVLPELVAEYEEEVRRCIHSVRPAMDVQTQNVRTFSSARIRGELRDEAFDALAARTTGSGYGAILYKSVTASNRWLSNKGGLYESDWKVMIKATINNCGNLTNPRMAAADKLCRKCLCCNETLAHITGGCLANNGLIINRHNEVVRRLAVELRRVGFAVDEEMRCVGITRAFRHADGGDVIVPADSNILPNGQPPDDDWVGTEVRESWRIDIFAVNKERTKAYVLDPTIRFESTAEAVEAALAEKRRIYDATVPDLRGRWGA